MISVIWLRFKTLDPLIGVVGLVISVISIVEDFCDKVIPIGDSDSPLIISVQA